MKIGIKKLQTLLYRETQFDVVNYLIIVKVHKNVHLYSTSSWTRV